MVTNLMKLSLELVRKASTAQNAITGANLQQPLNTTIKAEQIRGLQRRAALYEEMNERMVRSYDAGVTTKFNSDFRGTYTSANSEIIASDYAVRARARTVAKDTPQGKATVRTYQNNVVGDNPFKLDMRIGEWVKKKDEATGETVSQFEEDEDLNRAIEAEWEVFGHPENFTVGGDMSRMEAWRIMEGSAVRDGFVLQRHHHAFPYNAYGYAVELLECDRLQTQFMGKSPDGNPIRFSIEFDKRWNRKLAYWILSKHPGDGTGQSMLANYTGDGRGQDQFFRVRIDANDIIAFHNLRDRAEQDIGFTELDASVQSLWRLFQYEKALTYAAISSCMKPYWIKKNYPTGMSYSPDDFARMVEGFSRGAGIPKELSGDSVIASQQGIKQRQSTEVPGSTVEMEYGMELMQTDPKFPIEAAHEFRQDNQRDIAVASGVSYQDVSGDFQNLGFAAALMCQTPKQDYCKIRQRNFIDCVARPTFTQWLKDSILNGVFERKYGLSPSIQKLDHYVESAKFKGKRWAFVNPLVQAQTLIIMMEAHIISPQQVQDQLPDGVSIESLYTLIGEAKKEERKHGIESESVDSTRPSTDESDPVKSAPTAGEKPPAKTKPANPVRTWTHNRTRISPETMALIDQQGDGAYHNGSH